MKEILIGGAWIAFLYWRVRRAKDNAAELSAAGVLRAPLYWIGNVLSFAALGLAMYIASAKTSFDSGVWMVAIALFVAAIVARLLLRRRYYI
jgi:uncharacterized membrane protein